MLAKEGHHETWKLGGRIYRVATAGKRPGYVFESLRRQIDGYLTRQRRLERETRQSVREQERLTTAQAPLMIDWDHIGLEGYFWLGQYDPNSYTPVETGRPLVYVVVTGTFPPPLRNSAVPMEAEIHPIPVNVNKKQYAQSLGGVVAYGWYYEEGLTR